MKKAEEKRQSERAVKRRAFCRAYLETMDPDAAAARCGIEDGDAVLERPITKRELDAMRALRGDVRREDVIRRLAQLAFAPANDAVRLAFLDEPCEDAVRRLDLTAVAECRRNSAGSVELKLIDRVKALTALWEILGTGGENAAAEAFFRALAAPGEGGEA